MLRSLRGLPEDADPYFFYFMRPWECFQADDAQIDLTECDREVTLVEITLFNWREATACPDSYFVPIGEVNLDDLSWSLFLPEHMKDLFTFRAREENFLIDGIQGLRARKLQHLCTQYIQDYAEENQLACKASGPEKPVFTVPVGKFKFLAFRCMSRLH